MKKSTCKILMAIGIFWVVLALVITSIAAMMIKSGTTNLSSSAVTMVTMLIFLVLGAPGIIMIIVALVKWKTAEDEKGVTKPKTAAKSKKKK